MPIRLQLRLLGRVDLRGCRSGGSWGANQAAAGAGGGAGGPGPGSADNGRVSTHLDSFVMRLRGAGDMRRGKCVKCRRKQETIERAVN